MGTPIGYFGDDDVRDFPDLNKCPDCETFFDGLNCPLCGKVCPEEFRAGNRKPVKAKKKKAARGNGRVQFVPWYFSTWFIVLMLFFQPIIGLILLWMGYWRKSAKIIVTVLFVLYTFGFAFLGALMGLLNIFLPQEEPPVNTAISKEEYIEQCHALSAETIYREAETRVGEYVTLRVTVDALWEDAYAYYNDEEYSSYLQCHTVESEKNWCFLIRDYRQTGINFTPGDCIVLYGQIGGNFSIENTSLGELSAPGINMLYAELAEADISAP